MCGSSSRQVCTCGGWTALDREDVWVGGCKCVFYTHAGVCPYLCTGYVSVFAQIPCVRLGGTSTGRSRGKWRLADVLHLGKVFWVKAACGLPRGKPSWWPVLGLYFLVSFCTWLCDHMLAGHSLCASCSHPWAAGSESQVGTDSDILSRHFIWLPKVSSASSVPGPSIL